MVYDVSGLVLCRPLGHHPLHLDESRHLAQCPPHSGTHTKSCLRKQGLINRTGGMDLGTPNRIRRKVCQTRIHAALYAFSCAGSSTLSPCASGATPSRRDCVLRTPFEHDRGRADANRSDDLCHRLEQRARYALPVRRRYLSDEQRAGREHKVRREHDETRRGGSRIPNTACSG